MSEKNIIDTVINNLFQDKALRGDSVNWANWMSKLTLFTCRHCAQQHGKIVDISTLENKTEVNAHKNCKCEYLPMRTKRIGTVTEQGMDGVDVHLIKHFRLPNYYVTKEAAKNAGWVSWKGNLEDVLPMGVIGGNIYRNKDEKLPQATGRIWYEADINYDGGYRNRQRILYSNNGLIFVSYDHYQTFYEITN